MPRREEDKKEKENIAYVIEFLQIPPQAQKLVTNGYEVSFIINYDHGKIIVVPPVYPILLILFHA